MCIIGIKWRCDRMVKVNINLPEDLLEKTDKRAKQLGITRTAFITMTISEKLMQTDVMESLPEMLASMRKMADKEGK